MKKYILIAVAVVVAFVLYVDSKNDKLTQEALDHAYGSGYEAGMEAADEARYHASKKSPLPIENKKPSASMKSTPDSTCFSSVGYSNGTLYVEFRDSGSVYSYEDVPKSVYNELWDASSMGSYYNNYIKGYYECHRLS